MASRYAVRSFRAAVRLQVSLLRHSRGAAQFFVVVPLFAVIFLAVLTNNGRFDLLGDAVVAASLIGIWGISLFVAAAVFAGDRLLGVAELLFTTPSGGWPVLCGRVLVISTVSLVTFAETWLVAALLFGNVTVPAHPVEFVLGVAATLFAATGTASLMAALFAIGRDTTIARNSLSYPFYILGGVLVPVSLLPTWLQPVTRLFYLSWSSDLLRDSLRPGPVTGLLPRLAAVLLLGALAFGASRLCLDRVVNRDRREGSGGYQ